MTWQEKVIGAVRLHHATLPMLVAGLEDILLDPVYFRHGRGGLIDLVRKGEFSKQDRIVFLHTGGSAALFGYSGYFRNA